MRSRTRRASDALGLAAGEFNDAEGELEVEGVLYRVEHPARVISGQAFVGFME